MNNIHGKPVVFHTVDRILSNFPNSKVVVAAPEFDREGALPSVLASMGSRVELYFGFSESPLKRMLAASEAHFQQDAFIRLDGLNMFFCPEQIAALYRLGTEKKLDVSKFPDDYPVQFTADFYTASSLKRLSTTLPDDSPFQIHPKFAMMRGTEFNSEYLKILSPIDDETLLAAREAGRMIYLSPRDAGLPHSPSITA